MKYKNIIALIMAIFLLPSIFAGCAPTGDPASTTGGTTAVTTGIKTSPASTATEPPVTTTEEVTESPRTIAPDTEPASYAGVEREPQSSPPIKKLTLGGRDIADFVIALPTDALPSESTAAAELAKYIELATDVLLPIEEENGPGAYKIRLQGAEDTDLGREGFLIAFSGDDLTISGGRPRGVLYGVYTFLEDYLGCRFYTRDFELIHSAEAIDVPATVNDRQVPVFDVRDSFWHGLIVSDAFKAKLKVNHLTNVEDLGGGHYYTGGFVHTFDSIVPPSVYKQDHPEYYNGSEQLCITNPEVLEIAKAYVRNLLANDPNAQLVSVSQNDNQKYCMCENCTAAYEAEGTPMGPLLEFVNAIAADIKDDYPDVMIDTLAYQYTRAVPKTVRPLPNVQIRLCSIECYFTQVLEDPDVSVNAEFMVDLEAWSKAAGYLAVWDYTTNFSSYAFTFPNFDVLHKNVRTFAEYGVQNLFEQGAYNGDSGEFCDLKGYLIAKLLWNPYMSEEEYYNLMDEFLEDYYGPGWQNIRNYIDYIVIEGAKHDFPIFSSMAAPALLIPSRGWTMVDTWWDAAKAMASPQELLHLEKSYTSVLAMKMAYHLDLPRKISGGQEMYRKYKKLYEGQLERFNLRAGEVG